jgi:anti-anti-sigma regulatory factor
MSMAEQYAIVLRGDEFTHLDACRVYETALRTAARTIVIDLSRARDATTSAFARLVLLRRRLLSNGQDLRLTGLSDRAARLYEVSRLEQILPRATTPLRSAPSTPAPASQPASGRPRDLSRNFDFLRSPAGVR